MPFQINPDRCAACGSCIGNCPNRAIVRRGAVVLITDMCWDCGVCMRYCPVGAIGPGPVPALAPGKHQLQIGVVVKDVGPLEIPVADELA